MKQLSDKEIIYKVLNGNPELYGLIIDRYENPVAASIRGYLGNCPEAEEVGQDTFIRCYQSLDRFKGESSLKTYLIRIAINLSLNELKRRKRTMSRTTGIDDVYKIADKPEEKVSDRNELRDLINHALEKLESKQKAVIILRIIEGYSTAETAKILKVPVGTVLSRLSRAQENLRRIIGPNRY